MWICFGFCLFSTSDTWTVSVKSEQYMDQTLAVFLLKYKKYHINVSDILQKLCMVFYFPFNFKLIIALLQFNKSLNNQAYLKDRDIHKSIYHPQTIVEETSNLDN